MYLNPQIHVTQDTLTIHVGYIGIHSRIRISSPTCGRAWMRAGTNLRYMYLIMYLGSRMYLDYPCRYTCISHVSRMYPASQIRTSQDTFEIHVSQYVSWKYPACIPYVSSNLCRYMYPACIPHVSRIYPECIPHVSFMYLTCVPPCRCAYLATATGARKGDEEGEDSCHASRPAH